MRCWRVGDGGTLVEREPGRFVRFSIAGTIVDVYEPWGTSDQETIYRMTFQVQGEGLVQWTDVEPDRAADYRYPSGVVVRGLVPMAPEDCPAPLDGLDAAVDRFLKERQERMLADGGSA